MGDYVKKKKCVSEGELVKLEGIVKDLNVRLTSVEDCLLGLSGMKDRMCLLEKSMENALDRIMPRLDSLLAGLPAGATSHITAKPPIFPEAAPTQSGSTTCSTKSAVPKSRDRPISKSSPPERCLPPGCEGKGSDHLQKNCPSVVAASMKTCSKKTPVAGSSKEGASLPLPSVANKEKLSMSDVQTKGIERTRQFILGLAHGAVIAAKYKHTNGEKKTSKSKKKIAQMKKAVERGDLIACMKLVQLGADPAQLDMVTDNSMPLSDMPESKAMCLTFLKHAVWCRKDLSDSDAKEEKQETDTEKPSGSKDNA